MRRKAPKDSTEWKKARTAAFLRDRGRCPGASSDCTEWVVHVHHILPRSRGGKHGLENLISLCNSCHTYVHANPTESYERGWLKKGT